MNSLYRSPRARKNGAPDAEDTVPLAIAAEVTPAGGTCRRIHHTCRARGIRPGSRMAGLTGISSPLNEVDDWVIGAG